MAESKEQVFGPKGRVEETKPETKPVVKKVAAKRTTPKRKSAARRPKVSKERHAFGTCVPLSECPGHG